MLKSDDYISFLVVKIAPSSTMKTSQFTFYIIILAVVSYIFFNESECFCS